MPSYDGRHFTALMFWYNDETCPLSVQAVIRSKSMKKKVIIWP